MKRTPVGDHMEAFLRWSAGAGWRRGCVVSYHSSLSSDDLFVTVWARLRKECGRHCTQGSRPQPRSGDSSLRRLPPVAPFISPIYPGGIPANSRW